MAHGGVPSLGWMIDVQRAGDRAPVTLDVEIPQDEPDPVRLAELLAKALRRY